MHSNVLSALTKIIVRLVGALSNVQENVRNCGLSAAEVTIFARCVIRILLCPRLALLSNPELVKVIASSGLIKVT